MQIPRLERILVAIKPWERGLPLAAGHARALAESVDADILLVSTVFDSAVAARCERGDADAAVAQARLSEAARVELDRLAQSMREWDAEVVTRVVWGAPAYAGILRAVREWHADLLVVGVHEQRALRTRLTDTDWQLMRRAPCPVLLVKNPAFDGYRTILAAVDPLHAHDEPAGLDRATLAIAQRFKHAFGSSLKVLNAYPDAAMFAIASAVEVSPGVFYGEENVEALHRQAAVELAEQFGVAPAAVELRPGSAAEVIVAAAGEYRAELVAIGSPQRHGTLAALLGSTAEAVAAEAPCDVLLVPLPARPTGG